MSVTILRANALALPLADSSVDLVVTSPPYWSLRAYQDNGETYDGQIGAEATPGEFVDALIDCTREMVRVLKPSGSMWINLGDKMSSGVQSGVPGKSLIGIPWRYAIRCIDELGLILRAEVIWSKPNGLPESVTDRVRRSHEQWFHFTKEPRYFSAVDEIREPSGPEKACGPGAMRGPRSIRERGQADPAANNPLGKLPSSVWDIGLGNPLVRDILDAVAAGALTPDEGERLWTSASDSWGTLTPPASAGNGSAGRTHAATERPRPTSSHGQRTGHTESPTDCSLDPFLTDSPSTTPAATSPASDQSTLSQSLAQRTSGEHGPSAPNAHKGTALPTPTPSAPDTGRLPSDAAPATSRESTHDGSVWRVATEPLRVPDHLGVDHFAAFPTELPRRIIQGWSPREVCTACGEGRRPVAASVGLDMSRPQARRAHELAEKAGLTEDHLSALLSVGVSDTGRGKATQSGTGKNRPEVYALADHARAALGGYAREYLSRHPTGLSYACACPGTSAPTTPGVVLDPFGGTGTTALVADVLGRDGISVDMSADYCRLAEWRTTDTKQRAKAARVEAVEPVPDDQLSLFEEPA